MRLPRSEEHADMSLFNLIYYDVSLKKIKLHSRKKCTSFSGTDERGIRE